MSHTADSARLRSAMPLSTSACDISNRSRDTNLDPFRLAVGKLVMSTAEPVGRNPKGSAKFRRVTIKPMTMRVVSGSAACSGRATPPRRARRPVGRDNERAMPGRRHGRPIPICEMNDACRDGRAECAKPTRRMMRAEASGPGTVPSHRGSSEGSVGPIRSATSSAVTKPTSSTQISSARRALRM